MRSEIEAVKESERRELRQRFAGQAMQGLISDHIEGAARAMDDTKTACKMLAWVSVLAADALIAELEKT